MAKKDHVVCVLSLGSPRFRLYVAKIHNKNYQTNQIKNPKHSERAEKEQSGKIYIAKK